MLKKLFIFCLLGITGSLSAEVMVLDTQKSMIKWSGSKKWVGGSHNGTIGISSGQLSVDGQQLKEGKVIVDMNSIKNLDIEDQKYRKKLVGHLQSDDFFNTQKFPTSTFLIKSVKQNGTNVELNGHLTIRDKTHPETMKAVLKKTKTGLVLSGKFSFDRKKYHVTYNNESLTSLAKDKIIKNEISLEFELVANGSKKIKKPT